LANAVRSGELRDGSGTVHVRPSLHVPAGGHEVLRRIVGSWGSADLIDDAFEITEYEPDDVLTLGPLQVRFRVVPHFIRSHAVELTSEDTRFVFGADCAPNQALVEFARDADVLMVEATLPTPEQGSERGHMTPREAGEHGAAAHARRLVLTHYSDEMDPSWAAAEAADSYGGHVELAHEGAVYTL
jgi:ribonuclease BN (tRNA processing enzyme)